MLIAVEINHAELTHICQQRGIRKLALFGSVLREDFSSTSDIDVLVQLSEGKTPGFFGVHQISEELSSVMGQREIDLVTFEALSPLIRDEVLAEAEVLYAEE